MSLYKNQSYRNFTSAQNTQTVPKFNPKPTTNQLPNYNNWLGSEEGSKLLNTLREENSVMKSHNQNLEKYLKNVASVFKDLETENIQLRKQFSQSQEDLRKALESFVSNQNSNERDLQLQLESYEEELRVISTHLSEQKQKSSSMDYKLEEKNNVIQRAKDYNTKIEANLTQSLQREKDLSNEYQIKILQNQELTSQIEQLEAKINPLTDKWKMLTQQNKLQSEQIRRLETNKKQQEDDDREKYQQVNTELYQTKTDLQHFHHLCSQQEQQIKELKQQITEINSPQLQKQIMEQQQQNENLNHQINQMQQRLSLAQNREQQYLTDLQNMEMELDQLKSKYKTLTQDNLRLQNEIQSDLQQNQKKQQKNIEKIKSQYIQQIEDLNGDLTKLENEKRELILLFEEKNREIQNKDKYILEQKSYVQELENTRRQFIDVKTQLQQKDLKLELQQQQGHDSLSSLKKQLADVELRYFNCQELLQREQEKNEQLFQQNDQLKWYQEQYDELANKLADIKQNKDNTQIEINSYQSKINNIEQINQDLQQKVINQESDLKQHIQSIKFLEKKVNQIEELIQENKLLREQLQKREEYLSTDQEDGNGDSNQKPVNIYTKGFTNNFVSPTPKKGYYSQKHLISPQSCQICADVERKPIRMSNPYRK